MKNEKIRSIIIILISIIVLIIACKLLGDESKRAYNTCIDNGYSVSSCLEAFD